MPKNLQTTLALDPGLRDLGWAVFRGQTLIDANVKTFRFLPRTERHAAAMRAVRTLIAQYGVTTIVLEATRVTSHPSLAALHRWTCAVRRLAVRQGLSTAVYDVQSVRKSLVGNGWTSKRDAAIVVAAQYPALRIFVRQNREWKERYFQNMFDAIALGLYHTSRR